MDPTRHVKCPICLNVECLTVNTVNYCCDTQHAAICKPCMSDYINYKVNSSFMGVCPKIRCPIDHSDKKNRILDFHSWSRSSIVSDQVTAKYWALAHSVLSFVCGGCHTLKSISVSARPITEADLAIAQSQLAMSVSQMPAFTELKQRYCDGVIDVDEFYSRISAEFLPNISRASDHSAWLLFKNVLLLIDEPERQSSLYLRYLRERPRIWTPCCNVEHCFKCKTRGSHAGKTCDENLATLDTSIVSCPSCGIAITKGDGCNLMTCVCGKKFSWPDQGDRQRAGRFELAHPFNTAQACVAILSTDRYDDTMRDAQAWCAQHRMEMNPQLIKLWLQQYGAYPSQACAVMDSNTASEALRLAAELWANEHAQEVQRCKEMNAAAVRSLFLTLNPLSNQRAAAAVKLFKDEESHSDEFKRKNQRLLESARMWISANSRLYQQELKTSAEKASAQFLYVYGRRDPSSFDKCSVRLDSRNPDSIVTCSVVSKWESDENVKGSEIKTSLKANLLAEISLLSIRVTCTDDANRSFSDYDDSDADWFAFGLTRGAVHPDDGWMALTGPYDAHLSFGSRIEADCLGLGQWYPGYIKCVGLDGAYTIVYDCDFREANVEAARIRSIAVGSRVEAQKEFSDQWQQGRITYVSSNGMHTITFDNGVVGNNISVANIRLITPKSSWGIFDNRRSRSPARISASPPQHSPSLAAIECPKIRNGDVLTAIANPAEGWLQLSVNGSSKHTHRIQIPRGACADYSFTVKVSRDIRVSLEHPVGVQHAMQLQSLRDRVGELHQLAGAGAATASSCSYLTLDILSTSPFIESQAQQWRQAHGDDEQAALAYSRCVPAFETALQLATTKPVEPADKPAEGIAVEKAATIEPKTFKVVFPGCGGIPVRTDVSLDSEVVARLPPGTVFKTVEASVTLFESKIIRRLRLADKGGWVSQDSTADGSVLVEEINKGASPPSLRGQSETMDLKKAVRLSGVDTTTATTIAISANATQPTYTWQYLVGAVCWRAEACFAIMKAEMETLAIAFKAEHQESAAFVANGRLADSSLFKSSMELREAQAFAHHFAGEMRAWQEYNAALAEPLFLLQSQSQAQRQVQLLNARIGRAPAGPTIDAVIDRFRRAVERFLLHDRDFAMIMREVPVANVYHSPPRPTPPPPPPPLPTHQYSQHHHRRRRRRHDRNHHNSDHHCHQYHNHHQHHHRHKEHNRHHHNYR